jgi:hypothetical protein
LVRDAIGISPAGGPVGLAVGGAVGLASLALGLALWRQALAARGIVGAALDKPGLALGRRLVFAPPRSTGGLIGVLPFETSRALVGRLGCSSPRPAVGLVCAIALALGFD